MKRLYLFAPLFLAACGLGPHDPDCLNGIRVKPCPDDVPPHLCDCQPFEGGSSFAPASVVTPPVVTPDPKPAEPPKPDVKPDPKPETPKPPSKPDHPKPEAPSKPEEPKHEPKTDDC